MKIAIIGRSAILYNTAQLLHLYGHQIAVVITDRAAPEYTRTEEDFRRFAESIGAPFVLTHTLNHSQVQDLCKGLDIGITVNWRTMIRERHIKLFRLGILNGHLGDLPEYRGNACPNWAIINGDDKITASVHFIEDGKLDCGRVVGQTYLTLNDDDTIEDVYQWSETAIPKIFNSTLDRLQTKEDYTLKIADPESPESFRCYPRLPEDGFIDWNTTAKNIHNLIRAVCPPLAGAYTYHDYKGKLKKLIILKSRIVQHEIKDLAIPGHILKNDKQSGESWVKCSNGIVAVTECRYDGEIESFSPGLRWKSIRMRLGIRVDDWIYRMSIKNNQN